MKPYRLIAVFCILFMAAGSFARGLRADHPNYCEIKYDIISIKQQNPKCHKKACTKRAVSVDQTKRNSDQIINNDLRYECVGLDQTKPVKDVPNRMKPVKNVEKGVSKKAVMKEKRKPLK